MAEKKFIIEVRTKGFARANRNFKQLNTDGKKYVETTKRMRRSTAGLEASLGSLRNRLLVNAFAIAAVTKAAQAFFRSAIEFEDVKARLVGLTGSVEGAEFAFKKLNQVAATTPFQLSDVVNAGAQLEAFGASATDTIKPITDLAAFMGTTATEAANAFGRAYAGGAGAADILRERGVLNIIKSFKGIEDLSKITLPEFREALLGALVDPTVGIEGSSERMSKTFSGAMSNMLDSLSRLTAAISSRFLPSITDMVKGITDLSNAGVQLFTSVDMTQTDPFGTKELSGRLGTLTIKDIPKLRQEIAKAEADFTKLQKKREQQPLLPGMIEPVQFEQFDLSINTSQAEESTKSFQILLGDQQVALDQTGVKILELGTGITGLINPLADAQQAIRDQIEVSGALGTEIDVEEGKLNTLRETLQKLEDQEKRRNAQLREEAQAQIQRNAAIQGRIISQQREIQLNELNAELDSELLDNASLLTTAINSNSDSIEKNIQIEQVRLQTIAKIRDSLNLSEEQMKKFRDGLDLTNVKLDENGQSFILANGETVTFSKENAALVEKIILASQTMQLYNDAIARNKQELADNNEQQKIQAQTLATFNGLFLQTDEGQRRNIESTIALMEANKELIISQNNISEADFNLVIKNLNSDLTETVDVTGLAAASLTTLASSFKELTADGVSTEKQLQIMLRTIGSLAAMFPGGQLIGAGFTAASMLVPVGHTGGLIRDNSIQRFATGGMVQGQDNVPIMAQAGEFIMQRSAVQNIGVQNLADMNRTGNAGGVTVNIQGNMIGNDEFVRDSLIPQLKEVSNQNLA